MTNILATALGLFLLSGSAVSEKVAIPTMEVPRAPAYEMLTVLMTGYNPVSGQTNEDPMTTASGARSNPEVVAARSRDLADALPYGTVIEVIAPEREGAVCGYSSVEHLIGYRVIADAMHARKSSQIDIMFDADARVRHGGVLKNPAVVLGVCKDVEIRVVGFVDIKKMPRTQLELAAALGHNSLALTE